MACADDDAQGQFLEVLIASASAASFLFRSAHASTRPTQLYDRRSEEVRLDGVERIVI